MGIEVQGESINDFSAQIYEAAKANGFYEKIPRMSLFAAKRGIDRILREAALNEAQRVPVHYICSGAKGKPGGITYDIARCIYILLRYCGQEGIDIEKRITEWHLYGANRK